MVRSSLCSFKAGSKDPISNRAHPILECRLATNSFLLGRSLICLTFLRHALASCKLSDAFPSANAEIYIMFTMVTGEKLCVYRLLFVAMEMSEVRGLTARAFTARCTQS